MSSGLSKRVSQAFSPFLGHDPFNTLQKELNDLLTQFRSELHGGLTLPAAAVPSLDLSETADAIQARLDIPGFKSDEIHVEVSGNLLKVSGNHQEEKAEDKDEGGRTYHCVERRVGSFSRSVPLPAAVKEDKVTADCKDGVLTITLPKKEVAKSHKVKVTAK